MQDKVNLLEKIYFDKDNNATGWVCSWDNGETWEAVDCSLYPDGRPPFVIFNPDKAWEKYFE